MLLIFDCDGVVLDSMRLHNEAEAEIYHSLGIMVEPAELNRRFAGVPMVEELAIHTRETGVVFPSDTEARMERRKEELFAARLQAMPGIGAALDALADLPRCIASGTRLAGLRQTLGQTGLYERFAPHVFSSEQVARGKPAPDLFLYAAAQMGHAPADCLVIEDAVSGVTAAHAAGMRAIGFTGGGYGDPGHAARLTAAGAMRVIADLAALPPLIRALQCN